MAAFGVNFPKRNVDEVKKGKIYGLTIESTVVVRRPQYCGSSSSSSDWVQRDEFEELRSERNELWAQVVDNKRQIEETNQLVREMMLSMNFQLSQIFLVTDGAEEEDDDEFL